VDGDKVICTVGGPDALAVAFDKKTGKEVWKALDAREPGYAPPVILTLNGRRQLIVWCPESLNGLDPETGKTLWTTAYRDEAGKPFALKAGMSIATPRPVGTDELLVSCFYDGSMLVKVPSNSGEATTVWQGKSNGSKKGAPELPKTTDGLHSVMATPFVKDGYIYGICSYGQLRCLKADTGERVWATMKAVRGKLTPAKALEADEPQSPSGFGGERWAHAFLIENGGRFFIFNEQGDLVIAKLTPKGYEEIDRAHILEATNPLAGRPVVWMHPAFADKCMFARNDKEIVCVSLAK
jgi:outer membrane protein assembly factor BamB